MTATSGYCPLECNNHYWYIGIFSLFVLIHSTSEVGSMLLTLRCVHAKDKAMALGLIQFAIGLFGKKRNPVCGRHTISNVLLIRLVWCLQPTFLAPSFTERSSTRPVSFGRRRAANKALVGSTTPKHSESPFTVNEPPIQDISIYKYCSIESIHCHFCLVKAQREP